MSMRFDKLQGSPTARGLDALAKRHDAIGETVVNIHKQLKQIRADIEVLEQTAPMLLMRRLQ
jgi:hypothetical protein